MGSAVTQCQGHRHTSANLYLWAGLVRTVRHSSWKTQGMFLACEEGCLVVAVGDRTPSQPFFLTYDKNRLQKTVALDGGHQHKQGDGEGNAGADLMRAWVVFPGRSGGASNRSDPKTGNWSRQLMWSPCPSLTPPASTDLGLPFPGEGMWHRPLGSQWGLCGPRHCSEPRSEAWREILSCG